MPGGIPGGMPGGMGGLFGNLGFNMHNQPQGRQVQRKGPDKKIEIGIIIINNI